MVVSDASAVRACVRFADDHRLLVEPACGAALAPAYEGDAGVRAAAGAGGAGGETGRDVVVVVCGGAAVDLGALEGWRKQFPSG